jgi:hypothetical protein
MRAVGPGNFHYFIQGSLEAYTDPETTEQYLLPERRRLRYGRGGVAGRSRSLSLAGVGKDR